MNSWLMLIIGLALGSLIGWLVANLRKSNLEKDLSSFQEKALLYENTQNQLNIISAEKKLAEGRLSDVKEELISVKKLLDDERNKTFNLTDRISRAEEIYKSQKEKIEQQKIELEEITQKLQKEFENIANRLLDEKSQKFTDQNKSNMDIILNPLKERIKEFEEKVDKTYKSESGERINLQAEIKQLVLLNQNLQKEANNLASALKGDNKTQGNWGEIILEKVLEMSGLQKGREYHTQYSMTGNEGEALRPDVVIMLPDNKQIIIDSKVSLNAYENWASSELESDKKLYIKQHIDSVRNHIKILSDKNYQAAAGINTPDMVLLFMPIEPAFAAAWQNDQELYEFAWSKKIVIVSPSTLLATLKTISSIWQQDKQVKNALEIARQGGELYDKISGYIETMDGLGNYIKKTNDAFEEAQKKLFTGKGNIVNRAQKLQELGIKTTKKIADSLLNDEEQ